MHRGWGAAPAMLCPRRAISGADVIRELGLQVSLLENPSPFSMSVLWGVCGCAPRPLFLPVGVTAPCSGPWGGAHGPLLGESASPTSSIPHLPLSWRGCSGVSCPGPAQSPQAPCAWLLSPLHLTRRPWKVSHLPRSTGVPGSPPSSCSPPVFRGRPCLPGAVVPLAGTRVGPCVGMLLSFADLLGSKGYSVFVRTAAECSFSGQGIGSHRVYRASCGLYQLSWLIFIRRFCAGCGAPQLPLSTSRSSSPHLLQVLLFWGLLWYLICTYL